MPLLNRFFKRTDKKEAISWSFFDFANSAYTIMILSFVFPVYFKEVIAGNGLGDLYWGIIVSASILAGALASPIIGAAADHDTRRKRKFIIFALIAMVGTAGLYFTGEGTLLFAAAMFIIANFSIEISQSLYDSFLAKIATRETVGRISGLGWGLGYLGGIVAMLLLRPLYADGYAGDLDSLYRLTFPLTALFFAAFSVPAFVLIRENRPTKRKVRIWRLARISLRKTLKTIRQVKKYKNIAWFLIAFYFMNDALVTVFAFVPIYAKTTLNLTISEIMIAALIGQLIGFISTVFLGWLSDIIGSKKILLTTLVLWAITILLLSMTTTTMMFYIVVAIAGCIMGSSQAVARSWLSKMIPAAKRCEFFGFNGFASKISATTGPLIFGAISVITSNQRIAVAALLPFFIISLIIFSRIKE